MAAANFAQELREELTCPVCLDCFTDPVSTDCEHNFCRACLTQSWEVQDGNTFCPLCREPAQQRNFQPNPTLANIVEISKEFNLQVTEGAVCERHQEPLTLFCRDDKGPVCVVCKQSEEHREHRVIPVEEAEEECKEKIQAVLEEKRQMLVEQEKAEEQMYQLILEQLKELIKSILVFQSELSSSVKRLTAQMKDVNETLVGFQEQPTKIRQDVKYLKNKKTEHKIESTEAKMMWIQENYTNLDGTLIRMEMERAAFFLRFQNLPEETGENVYELIIKLIATEMEKDPVAIEKDVDVVYRINSRYAKLNNTPREIMVEFTKRAVRDSVLKLLGDKRIEVHGNEIKIFRVIPWRVRQKRTEYKGLASILRKNGIIYRWLIPEGLAFMFKTRRYRLNSTMKAEQFVLQYGKELGEEGQEQEEKQTYREDTSSEEESEHESEGEETEGAKMIGVMTRQRARKGKTDSNRDRN